MTVIYKAPSPKIEVYSPIDYSLLLTLSPEGDFPYLLSYSFTESIQDMVGSFNFSIAGGNNSLFDTLKPLHIIKIYEGLTKPSFVGVITHKNISTSMTDKGVKRSISFSGKSVTSFIAEFQLILDLKLLSAGRKVLHAQTVQEDFILGLNELQSATPLKIGDFLRKTWELYLKYTGIGKPSSNTPVHGKAGGANIAVYNIINAFMNSSFFEVGNAEEIPLPIANTFFNQDINTIIQIWQCILAPPVYEMFSRVNVDGMPKVVVRETPFDSSVWKTLNITTIKASELIDYSLNLSNEEVYTTYLAYLEGSQLDANQYIVINAADAKTKNESIFAIDDQKFEMYGLRMCQVNFRGYSKVEDDDTIIATMAKYSKRLKEWFSHLDEMYVGSITIVNRFDGKDKVRIGERVKFLGGEFYVRNATHSFSYGQAPTISLQVIRGAKYTKEGVFSGVLENVGTTRVELNDED